MVQQREQWVGLPRRDATSAHGNFTDPHNHYPFSGKEWDEHLDNYEVDARDYDTWTYVLPDALGSVRQTVDAAGAVVRAREWTPFGVAVGESTAGLGYTGEWFDADVGLEYLRARWYRPGTGRFTQ
ncbi:MAG: hypothetical protein K8R89_08260, partial [Anaerolineae bacterium]|nr:hypothetical protein [Anaerolineae bacterium]